MTGGATYRIASASIQDSRDEVFQIANVLSQKELSESLQPDEAHQIANVLPQMESSEFSGTGTVTNGVSSNEGRRTKVAAEQLDHQWTCSTPPVTEEPALVAMVLAVE